MLESIFLQFESVGLQHLLEPMIDTHNFGCPNFCIEYGSPRHDILNFLLSPILFLSIGIAVFSGLLVKFYINRRRKLSIKSTDSYVKEIVKQEKETIFDRKSKEILKTANEKSNPPYLDWIAALDPKHPQTEYIQSVHAETKEIVTPEQKVLEQQVEKIMSEEHISEDKATDKVVKQLETETVKLPEEPSKLETETIKLPEQPSRIVEKPSGQVLDVFQEFEQQEEKDLFKQDIEPKQYPKKLVSLQKKLKLKRKEKPLTRSVLTDLGKVRRDQYAQQIEQRLLAWALPLPEYKGKHSEVNQKSSQDVLLAVKKLALFCSMAEFMKDKKRKKKRYWREIPVAK